MVILIAGASHTGKTALAQRLVKQYGYFCLSIDHLKMGLIRSGYTDLTPEDDGALTGYLWPVVREMAKTAVENRQNLVIEGCYIPFDWQKDFPEGYLRDIRYICLAMTENYIRTHFADIKAHARAIEQRGDDSWCTLENTLAENAAFRAGCARYGLPCRLIDREYRVEAEI